MKTAQPTTEEILSIYDGIENVPGLSIDLQGWNSDTPIFRQMIEATKPKTIIEVGSWKGASAVHMATICRELGLSTVIYAVDLWVPPIGVGLGEFPRTAIPQRWNEPDFYQQFLFNIKSSGCHDRIIPVRGLTTCCASIFRSWEAETELIYLDASHDEDSVYRDLIAYWPLIKSGGYLLGDDYASHFGVRTAVQKFARLMKQEFHTLGDGIAVQWYLKK